MPKCLIDTARPQPLSDCCCLVKVIFFDVLTCACARLSLSEGASAGSKNRTTPLIDRSILSTALTSTLRPDFRKVSEILDELDRLVLRFRRTEPGTGFAEAWQPARIVPAASLRHSTAMILAFRGLKK